MPRVKQEREVSNDGTTRVIEITTAAGGEDKGTTTAQYSIPATAAKFQEMILGLSDSPDGGAFVKGIFGANREDQKESPLAFAYRAWVAIIDKMQRASVYEAVQAESTEISTGPGAKFDLMTVPANKLVVGINGMRGKRTSDLMLLGITDADDVQHTSVVKSVDRKLNYNQFQTAARKLVEASQARENVASGMLEFAG